jgi:hypothetical protein
VLEIKPKSVEPLNNFIRTPLPFATPAPVIVARTKILLDEDVGVIDAVKPVSTRLEEVVVVEEDIVPATTCNTLPAGNPDVATPSFVILLSAIYFSK